MTVLKYDINLIGYMNTFKQITGVDAKDCFTINDMLIFVTDKGKAGLAIGKEGKNIQALKRALMKDIKIIEHSNVIEELVANFVFPLKPAEVSIATQEDKKVINIRFNQPRERRYLLSQNQIKLKQLKTIVKRYNPEIEDILVL
jgi:N utilization substance protein A